MQALERQVGYEQEKGDVMLGWKAPRQHEALPRMWKGLVCHVPLGLVQPHLVTEPLMPQGGPLLKLQKVLGRVLSRSSAVSVPGDANLGRGYLGASMVEGEEGPKPAELDPLLCPPTLVAHQNLLALCLLQQAVLGCCPLARGCCWALLHSCSSY